MTVTETISGLDDLLAEELQAAKIAGQSAMAEKFFEITRENFGDSGVDRPIEWQALSPKYAKRVGRENATLFLSGELEASLNFDGSNPQYSEVWTGNEYASAHQFGNLENNLPPRPFMPILNTSEEEQARLTPLAEEQVIKAGEEAINQRMK